MALQGHKDMRKGAAEQFGVEKIIRVLKGPVLGRGDGFPGRDRLFHGVLPLYDWLIVSYDTITCWQGFISGARGLECAASATGISSRPDSEGHIFRRPGGLN